MKREKKLKNFLFAVLEIVSMMAFSMPVQVHAAAADPAAAQNAQSAEDPNPTLMQWKTDDDIFKLYVNGTNGAGKATYKIDGVEVKGLDDKDIADDDKPMRTLILLDNSASVSADMQAKVSEIVNGIINGHGDGEKFRIATFSDKINYLQDKYSSDYTAILNVFNNITYQDQETHLIDVLYNAITSLNDEKYMGYDRIVVLSAEYNSATTDVQLDELTDLLDEKTYPIYCFGIDTGSNSDQLTSMFELSRSTNADYCIINSTETADILSKISKDNFMKVFSADIPGAVKNGGSVNSELSFKKADTVKFKIGMPMASKSGNSITIGGSSINAAVFFGIIAAIIVLIIIIAIIVVRSKTKANEVDASAEKNDNEASKSSFPSTAANQQNVKTEPVHVNNGSGAQRYGYQDNASGNSDHGAGNTLNVGNFPANANDDGKTVAINFSEDKYEKTALVNFGPNHQTSRSYVITLEDDSNPMRKFTYQMASNTARLGIRPSTNNIVISDDNTVSHNHCVFIVRGSDCYIKDVGSFNGTFINHSQEKLEPETENKINDGDVLTIGSHSYVFHIEIQ